MPLNLGPGMALAPPGMWARAWGSRLLAEIALRMGFVSRAAWRSLNRFRKTSLVVPAGRRSFRRSQAFSGSGAASLSWPAFAGPPWDLAPGAWASSSESVNGSFMWRRTIGA